MENRTNGKQLGSNFPDVSEREPMNGTERPLTVPEVAERLRVGRKWVYEHADKLGAYRVGKYLRFDWGRVTERLRAGGLAAGRLGSQPNDLPEKL